MIEQKTRALLLLPLMQLFLNSGTDDIEVMSCLYQYLSLTLIVFSKVPLRYLCSPGPSRQLILLQILSRV